MTHSAPRVLILTAPLHRPSTRVRVTTLLPWLEREGVRAEVVAWPRRPRQRWRLLERCRRHDVVVLQKVLPTALELHLLRRASHRLIYDLDDAVFLRAAGGGQPSRTRAARFARLCRLVDGVTAGNRYLAEAARQQGARTWLVPSSVPVERPPRNHTFSVPPVVGWIGSQHTLPYLEAIAGALGEAARRHPFRLHVIADAVPQIPQVEVVPIPWSEATEEGELRRLDVGLMPLPDDPWTRGKCAYKLLQYMAAGVPWVASPVGMNRELAEADGGGLLATDTTFAETLADLLESPERRAALGRRGRLMVERHYSRPVAARLLAEALREALETER